MDAHDGAVFVPRKPFMCKLCEYTTLHSGSLNMHIDSKHKTGTIHECTYCSEKFNVKRNLKSHMKVKHGNGHECDQCDLSFAHQTTLRIHKERKHQDKTYFCKECDFKANYKQQIDMHIDAIHSEGGKYECDFLYSHY